MINLAIIKWKDNMSAAQPKWRPYEIGEWGPKFMKTYQCSCLLTLSAVSCVEQFRTGSSTANKGPSKSRRYFLPFGTSRMRLRRLAKPTSKACGIWVTSRERHIILERRYAGRPIGSDGTVCTRVRATES